MAIVVKVANKSGEEQGTEPVCHPEQDAPIVGKEVEWKEEGTVNDGHTEAEPKGEAYQPAAGAGEVPAPETSHQCGDSGACGLGEQKAPVSSSGDGTSGTGDESQLTIPDLPDTPPIEAYGDDLPWHEDDDGADAGAPPPPVGEPEAEQAQSDEPEQAEAPTAEAEEGEEQGAEGEALTEEETAELPVNDGDKLVSTYDPEPSTEKAVMQTDKQMVSHGETVSHDHETETVDVPVPASANAPVAKVRYSCGFTKNIGEFNSFRADVAIELPCGAEQAAIEATYQAAVNFVDSKLQELYDQTGTVEHVAPQPVAEPPSQAMPDLPMAPPPPPA